MTTAAPPGRPERAAASGGTGATECTNTADRTTVAETPKLIVCIDQQQLLELELHPELDVFRRPAEQAAALAALAADPRGCVSVAVVGAKVVAYLALHPPAAGESWSEGSSYLIELGAVEVAPSWRGRQLAEKLLERTFAGGRFDTVIVFATLYARHYDLRRSALTDLGYRRLLEKLYGKVGFRALPTTDPDIRAGPANVLMARIGSKVPAEAVTAFTRLRTRSWLDLP